MSINTSNFDDKNGFSMCLNRIVSSKILISHSFNFNFRIRILNSSKVLYTGLLAFLFIVAISLTIFKCLLSVGLVVGCDLTGKFKVGTTPSCNVFLPVSKETTIQVSFFT